MAGLPSDRAVDSDGRRPSESAVMDTNAPEFRLNFASSLAVAIALTCLALGCGERADSEATPEQLPEGVVQLVEAMGVSEFDTARDVLGKLDRDALTRPQQALVDRVESQLHSVAGEYAPGLEALERALASGGLTPDEELAARFDRGWLYAQLGQPEKAVEAYRQWQEELSDPPSTTQLLTISEAHAAARDCAGAAALIARAYARVTPEETVDVAAALEIARPLCPEEPGLLKYGNLASGS